MTLKAPFERRNTSLIANGNEGTSADDQSNLSSGEVSGEERGSQC